MSIGTGESGKSTFIKQMRIIHGKGYSESDLLQFKSLVLANIYTAIQVLVSAMSDLNIRYVDHELEGLVKGLLVTDMDSVENVPSDQRDLIARIWRDESVQVCYGRRREYQLSDSAK